MCLFPMLSLVNLGVVAKEILIELTVMLMARVREPIQVIRPVVKLQAKQARIKEEEFIVTP